MAKTRILSFIGLVVTLAAAYGFERLAWHMREQLGLAPSATLGKSMLWVESIPPLVLAAMLMLLAWFVLVRAGKDVWVGAVFVVVGLVLVFIVAAEMSLESFWLSDRLTNLARQKSYGHYVAAFVAVIGIASLVAPKRRV